MAITLVGLQLIASLYKDGVLANRESVMEMGAQDLFPNQDDVAHFLAGLVGFQRDPNSVITAELLYKSLGFARYTCIDADGRHNALAFDLNKLLVQEYHFVNTFDLVTNFGTTEHVFDQCRVFHNIHDVCAPEGIMIHEVPFQKRLNQGLYNYQPTFFYDLACANRYELLGMYLGLPKTVMPYSDDLAKLLSKTGTDTDLLVVLQKSTEEQFNNPYNGKYLKSSLLEDGYGLQQDKRGRSAPPIDKTIRLRSTSDINLMSTERIARTFFRRIVRKVLNT